MIEERIESTEFGTFYKVVTCTVCGREEYGSCSNEIIGMGNCSRLIREWDGTWVTIHLTVMGDMALITYPDGVTHAVTTAYAASIVA